MLIIRLGSKAPELFCCVIHYIMARGREVMSSQVSSFPPPHALIITLTRASKLVVHLSATQVPGHATENQPWLVKIPLRELFFTPLLDICEVT